MQDLQFAVNQRTETMRDYVMQTWGTWAETAVQARVQEDIVAGRLQIIEVEGEQAGLWLLDTLTDCFHLDQIFIVPKHQRRGIGATLVTRAMKKAELARVPLQLWVLRVNPAFQFYTRLRFVVTSSPEARCLLRSKA